ncbi:helix-turn-helix domain-containing protein [Pseudoalteromonas mariniglutinosa]|uniref:helix-turn-helix domain-containing protein n=1 Tax=Pseudoalteromonas mariniglutinosa TaxID=206042 RepID=UPI003850C642
MKQRKRIYYNAEQRRLIWERYQRGDSAHDIARLFDRYHSSILSIIHKAGKSLREIARYLNRSPSTICREVNRHGGIKKYRASKVDNVAWENTKRPKAYKLYGNKALYLIIAQRMEST